MTATDDRQRIQDLMLAYAAAVDDNDMAAYRDCFADDVEIVGFGESAVRGADQWVASVRGSTRGLFRNPTSAQPTAGDRGGGSRVSANRCPSAPFSQNAR